MSDNGVGLAFTAETEVPQEAFDNENIVEAKEEKPGDVENPNAEYEEGVFKGETEESQEEEKEAEEESQEEEKETSLETVDYKKENASLREQSKKDAAVTNLLNAAKGGDPEAVRIVNSFLNQGKQQEPTEQAPTKYNPYGKEISPYDEYFKDPTPESLSEVVSDTVHKIFAQYMGDDFNPSNLENKIMKQVNNAMYPMYEERVNGFLREFIAEHKDFSDHEGEINDLLNGKLSVLRDSDPQSALEIAYTMATKDSVEDRIRKSLTKQTSERLQSKKKAGRGIKPSNVHSGKSIKKAPSGAKSIEDFAAFYRKNPDAMKG